MTTDPILQSWLHTQTQTQRKHTHRHTHWVSVFSAREFRGFLSTRVEKLLRRVPPSLCLLLVSPQKKTNDVHRSRRQKHGGGGRLTAPRHLHPSVCQPWVDVAVAWESSLTAEPATYPRPVCKWRKRKRFTWMAGKQKKKKKKESLEGMFHNIKTCCTRATSGIRELKNSNSCKKRFLHSSG